MPWGASAPYRRDMAHGKRRTFFVESYIPQLDAAGAAALSSRLKAAVEQLRDEGLPLAWIRSFALLHAVEVNDVMLIQQRAGVELDHVAEVVASG